MMNENVAIVTGASRGIGRCIALHLAKSGAAVAIVARDRQKLDETARMIETEGGTVSSWQLDVTVESEVEDTVRKIETDLGPVMTLVNNAGIAVGGPVWTADPSEWWRVMEVNLRGPFLMSRFTIPAMLERGIGRIINVASNAGVNPGPETTAYACSKSALLRLTDSVAASVASHGLQVFAISPGWVWTDMTDQVIKIMQRADPDFKGVSDSETFPPEAAADLVVRLASGEADVLSGRYIHVSHDLDDLIRNAAIIKRDDLFALRLNEFP